MTDRSPTNLPPFLAPAPPPPDRPRIDPDALLRARRNRQAVFERGVALALVVGMLHDLEHLRELHDGLRWLIQEPDIATFEHWLQTVRDDVLRAQRINGHE